jgi:hypothetical protein
MAKFIDMTLGSQTKENITNSSVVALLFNWSSLRSITFFPQAERG